jgi:uncharacterized membrane protein YphA (DoxX/SURF4 family)
MIKNLLSLSYSDWLLIFVRILLGSLFIFSGIVKLIPIEAFELKFVEIGIANWTFAPYLARVLIGFELFLGVMLLTNIKPKITVICTIALLVFFIAYLIYDIILNGNDSNCGCFGTFIVMTPLESIIKNLLMIPLLILLLVLNKKEFSFRLNLIVPILIFLSLALPFILYPVDDIESYQNANTEKVGYDFPTELIPDFNIKGNKIDLKKGEYLLAFMSVNCVHCKKAAYKLFILSQQKKLPPVYLVLLGTEELVPGFVMETKANFPYYLYNEKQFFEIAGSSIPKILYLKEGIVKAKFDNITLTEENLEKVLKTNP